MLNKKTVADVPIADKTVLVRVDFNVPLDEGEVADTYRIEMALPTIRYLLDHNCRVALISHLGRPKGEKDPKYSLKPVAAVLSELLDRPVGFVGDCVGDQVQQALKGLSAGDVLLLENTRFHSEEKDNDPEFAKQLAQGFDYFVQDAFGSVHRAHASTDAITQYLPGVAGFLVENEVKTIKDAIENPKKPLVTIIGGAKIESKIDLLEKFSSLADTLIIGGAMANTFLVAQGHKVGKSLYDEKEVGHARTLIERAATKETKLILPLADVGVAKTTEEAAVREDKKLEDLADDDIILDFGPESMEQVLSAAESAGTVLWNGPLGMNELDAFAQGTKTLAEHLIENGVDTIVGGGDTAGYIHEQGLVDKFKHVSTGGGASLELMAGKSLPGVDVLIDA